MSEREIKFRAWNLTENRFLTTEELIYRIEVEAKKQLILDNNLISLGGKPDPSDEIIFQQYTGLKDMNGVEIYEGDVVLWEEGLTHPEMYGEIKWVENGYYFSRTLNWSDTEHNIGWLVTKKSLQSAKIIGNIFEGVKNERD